MREIKFRAWDSTNNVWADRGPFHVIGEVTLFDCLKQYQLEHLNELVIEQYTGLHDKNDVEIYEGDILQDFGGARDSVVFDRGGFSLKHESMWLCFAVEDWDGEVIGSIHENPEMVDGSGS